jgi:hypothetical protein
MNLTYNTGVPNPPNRPSADVPLMQINTNNIPTLIGVDHFQFQNNFGGYHQQVHLVNESAPGIGTASGVLYANLATSQSWPFWQNALGSFQLMGQNSAATNGYVTIPGGIILQWGSNTAVTEGSFAGGTANGTVTFATANIAFPTNCFNVISIPFWTSTPPSSTGTGTATPDTSTLTRTAFNWKFNSNSSAYTGFFWIAIGN